jgi:hypothetical protein
MEDLGTDMHRVAFDPALGDPGLVRMRPAVGDGLEAAGQKRVQDRQEENGGGRQVERGVTNAVRNDGGQIVGGRVAVAVQGRGKVDRARGRGDAAGVTRNRRSEHPHRHDHHPNHQRRPTWHFELLAARVFKPSTARGRQDGPSSCGAQTGRRDRPPGVARHGQAA